MSELRQSGRSTRIASFAVEQLLSTGECIVFDHQVFEYENTQKRHLAKLEELVQKIFNASYHHAREAKLEYSYIDVVSKLTNKTYKALHIIVKTEK